MVRIRKSYHMDPAESKEVASSRPGGGIFVTSSSAVQEGVKMDGPNFRAAAAANMHISEEAPSVEEVVEREPLPFCVFIVKFPKTAFGLTLSGHLVMLAVSIVLLALGKNVFPAEFRQIPFELTGQAVTLKYWAWTYRNSPPHVTPRIPWNTNGWDRGLSRDPLQIMYSRHNSANLFEKTVLQQIQKLEDRFASTGEYNRNLCQVEIDEVTCVAPNSILRYFDGTFADISSVFNDTNFDNITGVVWEASQNPQTKSEFSYFLGNKTHITPDSVYTDYTRTEFFFGYPIPNINSWQGYIGERAFHHLVPRIEQLREELAPDVKVAPINWAMFVAGAAVYGIHDIFLVGGSVIFIFIFMWFQTGSFFVTSFAVFSIITSFFGTNLIYRYALDFRYFGYFHLIAMFIILGIGADDIFVFFNTWKASAFENHRTTSIRLSEVYRRAAVSMFVTSFTTMVAFFVTSMTPLIAARSFGIFTGILVIINYISVVVFFPTVVYLYHLYFENKDLCISCGRSEKLACCRPKPSEQEDEMKKEPGVVVRFFSGHYFEFISHRVGRWFLLLGFAVVFVFFAWSASTLKSDSEQVMVFKETTVLGRGWKYFFNAFRPNDNSLLTTNIAWGLRPRNARSCHFSDYRCRGEPEWDENFDINTPTVQLAMRDFCRKLKYNLTEQEFAALHIRRNDHGEAEVQCFMENMERFLQAEETRLNKFVCKTQQDLSLPLTEVKVRKFMECLSCFYNVTKLTPTFHRYFEIVMSYWITNRYTMWSNQDFKTFNSFLGEGPDGDNTHMVEIWADNSTAKCNIIPPGSIGHLPIDWDDLRNKVPDGIKPRYGTRLRYASIPVNLTVNFFGLGYATGLPIHDSWEEYLRRNIPQLPHQMQLAMQTNVGQWHWLYVQKTLVDSAVVGVALGICLALPVLILATRNYIIGSLATIIITLTCVCVVGVIPLPGWKLGMLVSINLCLVVGLSIDYIVHMAEAYHMSVESDRKARVQDTLRLTAVSVVAGAITTFGASFFMFFGKTQFFLQFAAFLFSTIGFSVIFSLGLFPIIMALCGPQGETGSLAPLWRAFKSCFTGRRRGDVDCGECRGKGFLPPPPPVLQDDYPVLGATGGEGACYSGGIDTDRAQVCHLQVPSHYVNPGFVDDNHQQKGASSTKELSQQFQASEQAQLTNQSQHIQAADHSQSANMVDLHQQPSEEFNLMDLGEPIQSVEKEQTAQSADQDIQKDENSVIFKML